MKRHILVTGGTGFIGRNLCTHLRANGDDLTVFSRQPEHVVNRVCGPVRAINRLDVLPDLPPVEVVVNLAGEGIAGRRWSNHRKQELWDSRIRVTEELITNLARCERPPERLISGSATGYYGDQGTEPVAEDTPPRDEFTHRLCKAWEEAAGKISSLGTPAAFIRLGPVAGHGGGFLKQMLPAFRLGLGGKLGNGLQYFPWVHREDVVRAICWLMEQPDIQGPWNLVSPNPVTNAEFTKALGSALRRPTWFTVPAPMLRLGLGEMSRLLLTGQRAYPKRLQEHGFEFEYPTLPDALEQILDHS